MNHFLLPVESEKIVIYEAKLKHYTRSEVRDNQ